MSLSYIKSNEQPFMVCRPYAQWFYKLVFRCFLNTLCTDYGIFRTEMAASFTFNPFSG